VRRQYDASVDVHGVGAGVVKCCHGNAIYGQLHATRDENTTPVTAGLWSIAIRALNARIVLYLPQCRRALQI
jgi:hypothetical protein